jgi:hypothetical protein
MKTAIMALGLFIMVALNVSAQQTPQEQDFISRLTTFQKAGDMAGLRNIYELGGVQDTGSAMLAGMNGEKLEDLILRGVKSVKFEPVFPVLQDFVKNGWNIQGGSYIPNLKPYKMLTVEFKTPVKNGSIGFSILTGTKDGRILICGYKKI